jgi:ribosomal protein S27E
VSDFISLTCPSCGNKLQITEDIDRFACAACGNEHIVNRSGGIVTLKPVIDSILGVRVGVEKTASELAIVRVAKEIQEIEKQISDASRKADNLTGLFDGFMVLPILILPFGCIMLVAGVGTGYLIPLIIGLISFIAIVILFKLATPFFKNAERKNKKKAQHLKEKLESKKRELAMHKEIVSKY